MTVTTDTMTTPTPTAAPTAARAASGDDSRELDAAVGIALGLFEWSLDPLKRLVCIRATGAAIKQGWRNINYDPAEVSLDSRECYELFEDWDETVELCDRDNLGNREERALPRYSTDSALVGAMLEWAAKKGWAPLVIRNDSLDRWEAAIEPNGNFTEVERYGASPAEALARALIAATPEPR